MLMMFVVHGGHNHAENKKHCNNASNHSSSMTTSY